MLDRSSVSPAFAQFAASYDSATPIQSVVANFLADHIKMHWQVPLPPRVVIDVGCGTGKLTHACCLRLPPTQIYGIDNAAPMLALWQQRLDSFEPLFGGNGGKGADIIFKADEGLKTLIDLRYQKKIKGNNGENGEGKNKYGSNSEDLIVKVPVGTTVKDADTGVVIADLTRNGEMATIAYGGRGGRGNVSLSSRNNPCPSYAENGEPGEVRNIKVELRMIADVGLVGMPSVGKSTILSMISNANPKIADYHFTTLSPNLGVVKTKDNTFVVADLPGLIEGASEGVGLGHKFLKHVERTKIIAHVIDMAGTEGRDPYDDYVAIRKELESFSPKLLTKEEIIIANKMDGDKAKENLEEFKKKIKNKNIFEENFHDGTDRCVGR